jgi:hypothetical protein
MLICIDHPSHVLSDFLSLMQKFELLDTLHMAISKFCLSACPTKSDLRTVYTT